MKKLATSFLITGLMLFTALCDAQEAARPAKWAQSVNLEGVPNFHKVSKVLYRSAQPTPTGIHNLAPLGIKTVVSLRAFHNDADSIVGTGLGYEQISMKTWHPERQDVVRFLQIVSDPKKTPVLLHCQHGSDRTGTMCAIYRIAIQGWTVDDAITEMQQGNYGFHEIWSNLEPWIRGLDFEALKKSAGI